MYLVECFFPRTKASPMVLKSKKENSKLCATRNIIASLCNALLFAFALARAVAAHLMRYLGCSLGAFCSILQCL